MELLKCSRLQSKKRNLIYNMFVGDGDTGSFAGVKEACYQKYGDLYSVVEEECVGHIQKRMGSGLREYKQKMKSIPLKDGKGVGVQEGSQIKSSTRCITTSVRPSQTTLEIRMACTTAFGQYSSTE